MQFTVAAVAGAVRPSQLLWLHLPLEMHLGGGRYHFKQVTGFPWQQAGPGGQGSGTQLQCRQLQRDVGR